MRSMINEALRIAAAHAVKTIAPTDVAALLVSRDRSADGLRARLEQHIADGRRSIEQLKADGESVRNMLSKAFAEGRAEFADIEELNAFIARLENASEIQARELRDQMKRLRKTSRAIGRIDPTLGAITKKVLHESESLGLDEIAERLDFALFLRALKAQHGPKAPPVATFTDLDPPGAIESFLRAQLSR